MGPDAGQRFRIGADVAATDGPCGQLTRVVIDPVAQSVTHLVVAPRHHPGLGRLVPVTLVEAADDQHIQLSCTAAHVRQLDEAEEIRFLPPDPDVLGYGSHALVWPYYGLGMPTGRPDEDLQPIVADRVPAGEAEVHRGDPVHASDGWIGAVQGLVIDPVDHHVTHILLAEGHLWGRRQVAIPISAAVRLGDEIRLSLSRHQVRGLPPVPLSTGPHAGAGGAAAP